MIRKKRFQKYLIITFWFSVIFTIGFSCYYMKKIIPDQLNVVAEEKEYFHFAMPLDVTLSSDSEEVVLGNGSNIPSNEIHLSLNQPFSVYSENQGSYQLGLKLFGWLKFKDIKVDVVDTRYAVPCGAPIGIYLKSKGIMVIGTGEVTKSDGMIAEPAFGVLQSGDYIEAVNGRPIATKEALITEINKVGEGEAVLSIRRQGDLIDVKVNPVEAEDGNYKLGAWVRDDTQGIGTMTYVDMNGEFGALGHGISDSDTGSVVEIEKGALYETEIMGIEKGSLGKPGVMSGVIYYGPGSTLGTIFSNTEEGIYGTVNDRFRQTMTGEALPVGYRQDVKKGKAYIRSSVSGEMKDYEIDIQRVDYATTHKNKGMVIRVVDPELLELTGGIVQGMVVSYNRDNTGNPLFYKGFQVLVPIFIDQLIVEKQIRHT